MINILERYKTLATSRISSLPVVVLMPYSACNCRCLMCDIWKDNKNVKQLPLEKIAELIVSFKKLNTRWITLSGGEALLHPQIGEICKMIKAAGMKLSILSTGITVAKHAEMICSYADELILSLDGPPEIHNQIRNLPKAFQLLEEGVKAVHRINPKFRITTRSVIQKQNFRHWQQLIETATAMGIKQLSFLPADISTEAFNHANQLADGKRSEILLSKEECEELAEMIRSLQVKFNPLFQSKTIAESPEKLMKIAQYYRAFVQAGNPFPGNACNAPWVSTVIEADGIVRHCFFLGTMGNIYEDKLEDILNKQAAITFRKKLDTNSNPVCERCVCYLSLKPGGMGF